MGAAIPSLIELLKSKERHVTFTAASTLAKLTENSE
jgi:hypothetical protein